MEDFHLRLARIGLDVVSRYGLALAGGYAVNAHGFISRPSADVDLFGALDADLPTATAAVVDAYRAAGLTVEIDHASRYYVRLVVTDPQLNKESKVELVADVRLQEPVTMAIGRVLHADDVAAGKMEALFTRAECRDFIDVDALLRSSRYDREQLLTLAARRDSGFDRDVFAQMLLGIDRFSDAEFARYAVPTANVAAIRAAMHDWHDELAASNRGSVRG
ncbi:MAG TPA: nucleotidyl transferase AbiEii/AbiGii toxin family protein [Actinocrinis sp.]|uniref:nucleotidyl transferase AbiEii/AbiGii toxin family protein n=1 Tax=Actinocrinis sp. TaxID=1920516 RepID=UPI002DDCB7CC|nr:nucleotidyl transferase AbiEii/AbiGii toxin family protein [Actinocrinis sp.]HEV2346022.1 nucleotidyl transferase AbiEii/AbiGii toxin family protein [Actinocrinis sp.]